MKRLVILLLLAAAPPSASALQLSDLRAQARNLAIDNGTRLRFSTATIDAFLNEGQRVMITETKVIRKATDFQLAAGVTYYALPSDFLQMQRATRDNIELGETSPENLAGVIGWNWIDSKGLPQNYYINWSSRTLLAFYPWPDTTSSTGTIHIEYYAQVASLVNATDVPFNGITELIPYHYALALYAAFRMTLIDGRSDLASIYRGEFAEQLERMRREAVARPSYHPGARPGSTTNRIVP